MIRCSGDWLCTLVGDELLMMSVERGTYLGLTEVGARVWDMLKQPREIADICAVLESEYDVAPEVCRSDVEAFVANLVKAKAATIDPI